VSEEPENKLVVAAAIMVQGRVLAARRSAPAELAGGWEFPGGKVEPGEGCEAAVVRECAEELGVVVAPVRDLGAATGPNESGTIELRLWQVKLVSGSPEPLEDHDELRWLGSESLGGVSWLPIDLELLDLVRPLLR
jgi:8-oxo-dGTP diphosphatase